MNCPFQLAMVLVLFLRMSAILTFSECFLICDISHLFCCLILQSQTQNFFPQDLKEN